MHCKAKCVLRPLFRPSLPAVRLRVLSKTNDEKAVNYSSGYNTMESTSESESSKASSRPQSAVIPDDVVREFEMKLEGDLKSVGATLVAGIGVITWWRGVWALLDHYIGDSVLGHILCVVLGLMIILYVRFAGFKLANFFPNL